MKVLLVQRNKQPKIVNVKNELEALQNLVHGPIEVVYPWPRPVVLVCNEEGKFRFPPNRPIHYYDWICGDFFLCGEDGEDFADIPAKEVEFFKNYFALRA